MTINLIRIEARGGVEDKSEENIGNRERKYLRKPM